MARGAWKGSGAAMMTASTAPEEIISSPSPKTRGPPREAASASARGTSASAMAARRAPRTPRARLWAWSEPMTPVPMMPMESYSLMIPP